MDIDFKKADNVIETMISKIFFFGGKAYKFYKWEKAFYGDLSEKVFREKFIKEDFFWNSVMSPDIYKELEVIKNEKGENDLCIVMAKFNSPRTFINCIEDGRLTKHILEDFVENIITKQRKIAEIKKNELAIFFAEDLKDIELKAVKDMQKWCYMSKDIEKSKVDLVAEKLFKILETGEYGKWRGMARKSACIDGNGDNFILEDGKILFIDVMPPKESWRVEDEVFNLARIAADIRALGKNDSLADTIYELYEKGGGVMPSNKIKVLYEVRAAMIQVAYRYILNQKNRAEKYLHIVDTY